MLTAGEKRICIKLNKLNERGTILHKQGNEEVAKIFVTGV